jgi:hypothetical protein
MPHDKNGVEVKVGDEVVMRFKVTRIYSTEEMCNAQLSSVIGMAPVGTPTILSAVNTRQFEVVQSDQVGSNAGA